MPSHLSCSGRQQPPGQMTRFYKSWFNWSVSGQTAQERSCGRCAEGVGTRRDRGSSLLALCSQAQRPREDGAERRVGASLSLCCQSEHRVSQPYAGALRTGPAVPLGWVSRGTRGVWWWLLWGFSELPCPCSQAAAAPWGVLAVLDLRPRGVKRGTKPHVFPLQIAPLRSSPTFLQWISFHFFASPPPPSPPQFPCKCFLLKIYLHFIHASVRINFSAWRCR